MLKYSTVPTIPTCDMFSPRDRLVPGLHMREEDVIRVSHHGQTTEAGYEAAFYHITARGNEKWATLQLRNV